jgi:hypothetical protein
VKKPLNTKQSPLKKGSPTGTPLGSPYAGATKDKQINTSYKKEDGLRNKENRGDGEALTQNGQIALDMKAIWVEEIGSSICVLK